MYLFISSLWLHSDYIRVWDGSGRMVFTRAGCQSNYTSSNFLETAFQNSQNITIQASLTNHQSYVRVSYGIIKDGLDAGKEYKQLLKCCTRNFYFSFKIIFISRCNAELWRGHLGEEIGNVSTGLFFRQWNFYIWSIRFQLFIHYHTGIVPGFAYHAHKQEANSYVSSSEIEASRFKSSRKKTKCIQQCTISHKIHIWSQLAFDSVYHPICPYITAFHDHHKQIVEHVNGSMYYFLSILSFWLECYPWKQNLQ